MFCGECRSYVAFPRPQTIIFKYLWAQLSTNNYHLLQERKINVNWDVCVVFIVLLFATLVFSSNKTSVFHEHMLYLFIFTCKVEWEWYVAVEIVHGLHLKVRLAKIYPDRTPPVTGASQNLPHSYICTRPALGCFWDTIKFLKYPLILPHLQISLVLCAQWLS